MKYGLRGELCHLKIGAAVLLVEIGTKAIAVDYAAEGIRANAVLPGDMETPMIQDYFAGQPDPAAARAEMEAAYPIKRLARPREVAQAVRFLVSPQSAYVNGTHILVDGGLTAKTY